MARSPDLRASAPAHLSSPEQLDTLVRVTRPRGWIALGAVGLVLVAFVLWTLFGSVQTTYQGSGILLTQYGSIDSATPQSGEVTALFVAQDDVVEAGDPVASIETVDGETVTVPAPGSGRIIEVLAYPNDHLDAGAPLATIQPDDQDLHCFLYVALGAHQPIRPGMEVQLSVTTVPSEEYGLLLGTVEKVGSFPATRAGIDALLNNPDITAGIVGSGPVIQVEVTLTRSSTTPSGYAWTSGDGPPTQLSAGTVVDASVVTAVQHPISLLFPSTRTQQ